ncbi:GNAT family N-acetyltransferase [Liquorilactobacillus capillatus]|nr:GNAT family N-acetyltransferase [Liquorilactobacillus capillatus]
MTLSYKTPQEDETTKLWRLMSELDNETRFMVYEPGERKELGSGIETLKGFIKSAQNKVDFLEVAVTEAGKMVGYLAAERGKARRLNRTAYIVVGILAKYQGQGVGTNLFKDLTVWAQKANLKRLELTVMQNNTPAQHLYTSSGFTIEGVRKNSMFVDGKYINEYYMAKIL